MNGAVAALLGVVREALSSSAETPGDLSYGDEQFRVWVDDPEDAPGGFPVHRAPGGMHYYDVPVEELGGDAEPDACVGVDLVSVGGPASMAEKLWVPYEGPRGGEGWKDAESGRVVYQDEPPGDTLDLSSLPEPDERVGSFGEFEEGQPISIETFEGTATGVITEVTDEEGKMPGQRERNLQVAFEDGSIRTVDMDDLRHAAQVRISRDRREETDVPLGVDYDDTREYRGATTLSEVQSADLKSELRKRHGSGADEFLDATRTWKGSSYNNESQTREKAFSMALGLDGDVRNGELNGDEPSESMVAAAKDVTEASREFMRRNYADEDGNIEVHRGLSSRVGTELQKDIFRRFASGGGANAPFTARMNAMDNFSTQRSVAATWGDYTATITQKRPVEDVVVATDHLLEVHGGEGEVSMKGGRRELRPDEITVQDEWNAEELLAGELDSDGLGKATKTGKHVADAMKRYIDTDGEHGSEPDEAVLEGIEKLAEQALETPADEAEVQEAASALEEGFAEVVEGGDLIPGAMEQVVRQTAGMDAWMDLQEHFTDIPFDASDDPEAWAEPMARGLPDVMSTGEANKVMEIFTGQSGLALGIGDSHLHEQANELQAKVDRIRFEMEREEGDPDPDMQPVGRMQEAVESAVSGADADEDAVDVVGQAMDNANTTSMSDAMKVLGDIEDNKPYGGPEEASNAIGNALMENLDANEAEKVLNAMTGETGLATDISHMFTTKAEPDADPDPGKEVDIDFTEDPDNIDWVARSREERSGGELGDDGKSWVPYHGPSGGEGWENTQTGRVAYQEDKPEPVEADPSSLTEEDLSGVEIHENRSMRRSSMSDVRRGEPLVVNLGDGGEYQGFLSSVEDDHAIIENTAGGDTRIPLGPGGEPEGEVFEPVPIFLGMGPAGADTPWIPDEGEPNRVQLAAEAARSAAATEGYGDTAPLESFAGVALSRGAPRDDVERALAFGMRAHPILDEDNADTVADRGAALFEEAGAEYVEGMHDREAGGPPESSKGQWVPYVGPDGGEGWQNYDTGEVRYQDSAPGDVMDPDDLSDYMFEYFATEYGVSEEEVRSAFEEAHDTGLFGDGGGSDPAESMREGLDDVAEQLMAEGYCETREDVNDGYCRYVATEAFERAGMPDDMRVLEAGNRDANHHFIEYGGEYYDAEATEGVDSPEDLPFFERTSVSLGRLDDVTDRAMADIDSKAWVPYQGSRDGERPDNPESTKGQWVPYVGPRGGTGWQDAQSGEVKYQDDPPGLTLGEDPADDPLENGDRVMLNYDGETHFGEVVAVSKNGESVRVRDDRNTWTLPTDQHEHYGGDMLITNLGEPAGGQEDPAKMEPEDSEELKYVLDELFPEEGADKVADALDRMSNEEIIDAARGSNVGPLLLGSELMDRHGGADVDGATVSANADWDGADEMRDRLREQYPESADEVFNIARGWEGAMYRATNAAPLIQAAMERTGNETMPEYDGSDVAALQELSDEQREAADAMVEFTQEQLREAFGDEVTLFRGFSNNPHGGTASEGTEAPDRLRRAKESGEEVEIGHRPVESWTLEPTTAKMYAGKDGAVLETTVPVEEIAASSSVGTIDASENDTVVMHDGPSVYGPDQIHTGDELRDYESMLDIRLDAVRGMQKDD